MKESIEKKSTMTIDTLALIVKRGFDDLEDRLGKRIDSVEDRLGKRIDSVEDRLGKRIDRIDERIDKIDERIDKIDERIDRIDERIDGLDSKLDRVEQNLREEFITSSDKIMKQLEDMRQEHAASFGIYKNIEERVYTLEQIVKMIQKKMGLQM